MVIESLINPAQIRQSYWRLSLVGLFYAVVSGLLAYAFFQQYASIAMVFFTVAVCVPFMHGLLKNEEAHEDLFLTESSFLDEYGHVAFGLLCLFIGITAGYVLLYFLMPASLQEVLFSAQEATVTSINGRMTLGGVLADIVANNMVVLLLSLALSFLYGFGALTIIVWNSSIVAYAIGMFVTEALSKVSGVFAFGWAFLRYFLHGIPEIGAYFIAGLAGGILSIAVMNHDISTKRGKKVLYDAFQLAVLSALLIILAGVIEVMVTPLLY
ncbi:MAG: stage II sporulation protein M [Nanoarchaeota archaeon]